VHPPIMASIHPFHMHFRTGFRSLAAPGLQPGTSTPEGAALPTKPTMLDTAPSPPAHPVHIPSPSVTTTSHIHIPYALHGAPHPEMYDSAYHFLRHSSTITDSGTSLTACLPGSPHTPGFITHNPYTARSISSTSRLCASNHIVNQSA